MAREKVPAFQFYPKDFLTDERVSLMSYTERGIYITLLSRCWLEQSLPADAPSLAKMLKLQAPRFQKLWTGVLSQCFHEVNGRLYHKRLDLEREKQESFRRRQSDNSASRWHASGNPIRIPPHSPRVEDRKEESSQEEETATLAAKFCERFVELYRHHRRGAHYHLKPNLDWSRVCSLLQTWDFARLEKLAVILLTTDDQWVSQTDRGIGVFVSKASWCDDRLREWETAHGVEAV